MNDAICPQCEGYRLITDPEFIIYCPLCRGIGRVSNIMAIMYISKVEIVDFELTEGVGLG